MAKAHAQIEGFDYIETFSIIAKIVSFKILLVVTSIKGWFIYQMDLNIALLHSDLPEDIYMTPPIVLPSGESKGLQA